ncbi:Hypothetical predicted protein [Paramuricea clavata]|uniref:Uncharacterized protein n=1 Tax=Paramuricea clavata TaxID=317549 RepID=A0A6S7HIH4_PARCT|nr:Hypothetical predicted protein [Paramuricea clavata]
MSSSPPQTQVPSSQDLGPPPLHTPRYHSEQVSVDSDGIFSPDEKLKTLSLLKEFDRVFDPVIPGYTTVPPVPSKVSSTWAQFNHPSEKVVCPSMLEAN